MNDNKNEIIYTQDCEFYRYQDRQKWNRFQTLSIIEGAVLFAVLKMEISEPCIELLIMLFGFALVLMVSIVSLIDQQHANNHLNRIKQFERDHNCSFPEKHRIRMGAKMMLVAIILINLFNVIFLYFAY